MGWSRVMLILFLGLFIPLAGRAESGPTVGDSLPEYRLRVPGDDFLQKFRNDRAFDYRERLQAVGWWQKFKFWLGRHFLKDYAVGWGRVIYWLSIVIACGMIVFLLYRLLLSQGRYVPVRDKEVLTGIDALAGTVLNAESYTALIGQAEAKKDFALAVRIHYRYILWLLDREKLISWNVHKTNLSYCCELKEEKLRTAFRGLTSAFDCVCYGEFAVDEALYRELCEDFQLFQQQIGQKK